MTIFVYINQRDAFYKHYQKFYSYRLLNNTSKNKDLELSLIALFKKDADHISVNKIITMSKDMKESEEFINDL
jgi:hypothetical protein